MKSLTQLKNIKGKRVLLRVDFNVPIVKGKILDDFRIRQALPTISYLRKKGAQIILLSHLGRSGESLKPVAKHLNKFFPVRFGQGVPLPGEVILLENLRQNPGEEKNDLAFAKKLARLGDIYVNEAFSVSHRHQASISQLPKLLLSYFGFQFECEIKNLSSVFKPKKPMLLILGGAKFETKMPLLKKFIKIADYIFVAGALANNFFKEIGFEVGKSVIDEQNFNLKKLLATEKIFIPIDIETVSHSLSRTVPSRQVGEGKRMETVVKLPNEVLKNEMIVDVGPNSEKLLSYLIKKSKTILWNGPLGFYEKGFGGSTEHVLKFLSKQKSKKIIIGGGDTVALISKLKLEKKFTFVSTGGGAMLEFLTKGRLFK